ncbi:MAG: putative lipid II flippase FtsW [Clostridiales bacterium]|nr:putative lipid II flippase FtsW [Clostridiales bacterium]
MTAKSNVLYMNKGVKPVRSRPAAEVNTAPLKKGTPDLWLLLIALFLVGIGVIMVFSASYYDTLSNDPYEYLKRQGSFAAAGVVITLIAMNVNYQKYRFLSKPVLYFTVFLLVAVFFFEEINHAHRWIPIGSTGVRVQPSEVAKFAMSLYMANLLSKRSADPNDIKGALGHVAIMLLVILGLVYKEPDLGATISLACIAMAILLAAGLHWLYAGSAVVAGGALVAALVTSSDYQMRRILGFLDPWADPLDTGYQLIGSYYALGSGGFWGVGIGASRQKLGFLPEQNTDFIFSIIGEELGFIGAGFIIILFLCLAWRGYMIAMRCPDRYGSLLATGITTSLALQAALNLGVVTGCLPVTGVTLPLVSYGGSSLLMSMGSVGVLLNISRYRK